MSSPQPLLRLPVGGMTCAACVAHVEEALRQEPGVRAVSVNLITRSASVTLDDDDADRVAIAERLVSRVEKAGYSAFVPVDDDDVTLEQQRGDAAIVEEAEGRLRRAVVALVAAAIAMLVSMPVMHGSTGYDRLGHALMAVVDPPLQRALPGLYAIDPKTLFWAIVVVFTPILVVVIWPIAKKAFAAARAKSTDMNTLVVLGAAASLASSFLGDIAVDAALFIVGFILLGQSIEARARGRTSAALTALSTLRSDRAHLVKHDDGDDEAVVDVATSELRIGDAVVVFPGERLPGDGVVAAENASADAFVDESHLTGESRPVNKTTGDAVLAGSINGSQPLRVTLTRLGKDSTLHQLLSLLRDAQGRRAPTQRLADRVAAVFVPSMILLAIVTFAAWFFISGINDAARFAVAVLVVACPCAMGLAVPTAVVAATGVAARAGVLIKGGDVLERLAHIDTVVFDKTGTLTVGHPQVRVVVAATGHSADDVMALSAGIEGHSEHPIAKAIADDASARGVKAKRVKNPRTIEGQGLAGELKVNDALVAVAIGNQRLLDARGIAVDDDAIAAAAAQDDGLFVTSGDSVIGFIVVDDAVRDDANAAVAALQAAHLGTQLLSGDRQRTAERIGRRLGIGTIRAEVSPKDKLDVIEDLAKAGHVAFVGDGVNDAAALARATVGIGMGGGGSDVAVAAADVALMRPRLMLVPELIALATRTRRIMLQNLGWAFGYNLVMLPLAAGLLSSWGLVLSPILASVAMSLSSVSVVMNSVRLTSHRMRGGEA